MDDFDHCSFTVKLARILDEDCDCGSIDRSTLAENSAQEGDRIVGVVDDVVFFRLFIFLTFQASWYQEVMEVIGNPLFQVPEITSIERRIVCLETVFSERMIELFGDESGKIGSTYYLIMKGGEIFLVATDPVAPTFK